MFTEKSFIILLFILSGIYIFIFSVLPLSGLSLGFKEFSYAKGIFSPWNGLKNFRLLWEDNTFKKVLLNTIKTGFIRSISLLLLSFCISLVLSEIKNKQFFFTVLIIILLPGFLSWVVTAGIFKTIFSQFGIINSLAHPSIRFFSLSRPFAIVLYSAILWRDSGFVILLITFALRSVDTRIINAAKLDGAGRWKILFQIKMPLIKEQFSLIVILILAGFSSGAFEAIFNLYNPALYEHFDILDTYIYRIGIATGKPNIGAALEMIKSIINITIVLFIIIKLWRSFHTPNPFSIPGERESEQQSLGITIGGLCIAISFLSPILIVIWYTFTANGIFSLQYVNRIGNPVFLRSLGVSFFTSVSGAILSTLLTVLLSYAIFLLLNRKEKAKKGGTAFIFILFFFLVLVNGGVISLYILVRYLCLRNTYLALFLPYLFNFIFLLYYIEELKQIDTVFPEMFANDGASVVRTFFHMNFGINGRSIANLFILFFIFHWNNWYAGVLFIDDSTMLPVNVFLRNIISFDMNYNNTGMTSSYYNLNEKMAFVLFSILPLILCFIAVQYINFIQLNPHKRRN